MKALSFFAVVTCWVGVAFSSVSAANGALKVAVLGVISEAPRAEFDSKFPSLFKDQFQGCSSCEAKNLTPYNEKGELDRAALSAAVDKAAGEVQVLYLAWNEVMTAENQKLLESLKKAAASGVVIVGPAGQPIGEDPSHSLSRTLLGQVPDAVIIGELNEKESLARKSFYGPEMLTAIKPPKELLGQGLAPTLFAVRLAKEWGKKSQSEWVQHFRARKSISRRIWPGLDEFFGR